MRILYLLRGVPGCGKTTFLSALPDANAYVISSDALRMQFGGLEMNENGEYKISMKQDKKTWNTLHDILKYRMEQGLTTFIDATHYSLKLIKSYQSLCNDYNYQLKVIDFSSVDLELCLERNRLREIHKRVPEDVILRMNEVIQKENDIWPNSIEIIPYKRFMSELELHPLNYSHFEKVVIFGDLHGCMDPLEKYFLINPFNEKTKYIFVGDYLDRGIQNDEVLNFILNIRKEKNVLLLEGNHEKWLRLYGRNKDNEISSKEFLENTLPQIKGIDRKSVNGLCKRLNPFAYFEYCGSEFLVTHGGLPDIPNWLTNEEDYIKGVGKYETDFEIDDKFSSKFKNKMIFSIHGHRNVNGCFTRNNTNTYNLEGKVEFGGCLRILEIYKDEDGNCRTSIVETKNYKFKNPEQLLLKDFENSPLVKEKELSDGIYSYNFTKEAFYSKHWSKSAIKARGIFIHKESQEIIARSYNKFFHYEEMGDLGEKGIENLKYPIRIFLKENGYLGLLSYNKVTGDFFVASKSTDKSEFAKHLKEVLKKNGFLNYETKNFLKDNDCTMVFEVCDSDFDPHIIKYENPQIILLEVIKNKAGAIDFEFSEKMQTYWHNQNIYKYGIRLKTCWGSIKNESELKKFIGQDTSKEKIEGWVLRDADGFMFKLKTDYYAFWKNLRGTFLNPDRILPKFTEKFKDEIAWIRTINKEKYEVKSYQKFNMIKLIDDYNKEREKM